jgi:hypothetical protein
MSCSLIALEGLLAARTTLAQHSVAKCGHLNRAMAAAACVCRLNQAGGLGWSCSCCYAGGYCREVGKAAVAVAAALKLIDPRCSFIMICRIVAAMPVLHPACGQPLEC